MKPTPPRVDCKQQGTAPIPAPPAGDRWLSVEYDGAAGKVVRLSEEAATWVVATLGIATQERQLRSVEHQCLDALAKKGVISQ